MRDAPVGFDWLVWLEQACKVEPSLDEHRRIKALARGWPTCACGQLCKNIPRRQDGSPRDEKLFGLGAAFLNYVRCRDWFGAIIIFRAIEARTTLILNSPKTFHG